MAAILAGTIGVAHAQTANVTPANVNVLNLLSPFLALNGTQVGQQTLQQNLASGIAANQAANTARQQLAVSDKTLAGSLFNGAIATITLADGTKVNLGPGDNLAGGLPLQQAQSAGGVQPLQPSGGYGLRLGPIYQTGIRASSLTSGPLTKTYTLLNNAYSVMSADLGVAKNYFANGAATNPSTTPPGYVPVPAVAPAGYTLPTAPYTIPAGSAGAGTTGTLPNTRDSVLDIAYGVKNTGAGQDVYGSSRPVQVTPSSYNIFDPTALNGLATNPSFPSGHTQYAFTDSYLLGMLVPQQFQSMMARAAEYGDSRIVLGVHYPLDIIASRSFAAYDIAQALTNPLYINNASTTGTAINLPSLFTAAQGELQSYISAQCGNTVAACATSAANMAGSPYAASAANQALYQQRLTYGLPTLTFAQAPREAAPTGGPDASILLSTLYGGSTVAAKTIAPNGGIYGNLSTDTINQIIVNTETNALAAFYGSALSYWSRLDLYSAAGYFDNVTGRLNLATTDVVTRDVAIGNGGSLFANGTITGVTIVQNGGLLGGSGTVGGIAAQSGSTVAPGNSIGTLNVAGNVAFAAGSTYQVEANAAGQSDKIAATGTTTLQGGTVQVLAAAGTYNPRTQYAILTSAGGVGGQFAGVTSNLAFLTPTLRYQPTEVDLTLTRNDVAFATVALNRNQAAAANGVQSAGPGSGVYGATVGLTAAEARGAFQALSGDIHASASGAAFETAFFVREAILDRLRNGGTAEGADYGSLPATYTADLPGRRVAPTMVPARVLDPRVFGVWAQGFGGFGHADTDGNAAGVNSSTVGFVAGADVRFENGFRLGVAGGYTRTNLDTAARTQSAQIESGFGAIYGGTEFGPITLRLGAVYSSNDSRTRRSVVFPGVGDNDTAHYGGSTTQGFGEIGYRLPFGNSAPVGLITKGAAPAAAFATSYIEPFVGGAYVNVNTDRFAETGGITALRGFSHDNDIGTATVGVRVQTTFDLGLGAPVTAHGLVGYRRAFGDVVPTALLAFQTGSSFVTAGLPIDRDALVANAGLDLRVSANATIGVAYTGQIGSRAENHAAKGNFTIRW